MLLGLGISLALLKRATSELNAVEQRHFPTLQLAEQMEISAAALQRQLQDAASAEDAYAVEDSDRALSEIVAALDGAAPTVMDPAERTRLKEAVQAYHLLARDTTLRLVRKESGESLSEALRTMATRYTAIRTDLSAQTERAKRGFREGLESARSLQRRSAIALVFIVLAAAGGSAVLGFWLARAASRPLEVLAEAARRIAQGDLRHDVLVESSDEVGLLAESFRTMVERLRAIVATLKQSSSELAGFAQELADQTRAQSALVERQAAGVTETSTSTRELEQTASLAASRAASVLEVAKRAAEMSEAGHGAAERSIEGIRQIQGTVESIVSQSGRLLEQTRQVGDIVETVRDLAAQSHVLSLNASIEAARAGEAGKSFAVVASEVRGLAEQSGQSATRIGKMVQDILAAIGATIETTEKGSKGVEGSAAQIRASGESLREIGGIVRETSDAALQIASAVQQQSTGIAQIAAAMQDLGKGMDESVTRIQVLDRSATELSRMAKGISQIAREFRT
jgi:methyl-accepting chemotaxis protein